MLRPMPLCFFRVTVTTSGSFLIGWKERWTGRTNCEWGWNLLDMSLTANVLWCVSLRAPLRILRRKTRRWSKKREGWEKGGKEWRRNNGERGRPQRNLWLLESSQEWKPHHGSPPHTHAHTHTHTCIYIQRAGHIGAGLGDWVGRWTETKKERELPRFPTAWKNILTKETPK